MVKKNILKSPINEALLKKIANKIVKAFHPEKIILFGSHAYGKPTEDSDVDLFIIMKTRDRPAQRFVKVHQVLEPTLVAFDIVVRTPKEVKKRLSWVDPFLHEVLNKGRVLYEANRRNQRVARKS